MTVRAYEDAFLRFLAKFGQTRSGGHAQRERLGGGIHVMEVQVEHAPVISADGATAACLGRKDPLDLLEPTRDSLADAALATPSDSTLTCAIAMKDHQAMAATLAQCRGAPGLRRSSPLGNQRHRRYRFCGCSLHEHMFAGASDAKPGIMRAGPLAQWQSAGLQQQKER